MNLYFLVEGEGEKKVYPAWLSYLLPELARVKFYDEVEKNNYYLISGGGYPSIINNIMPKAIEEIVEVKKYQYFVVCLDADEVSIDERKAEIKNKIVTNHLSLGNTKLVIIIQNRCFETWCLGNRRIYSQNPQISPLKEYTLYYNVFANCPELMGNYHPDNTYAQFHYDYLRELFKAKLKQEKSKNIITYSKKDPGAVMEEFYLKQLIDRVQSDNNHLPTFQEFITFCEMVKSQISI